LHTIESYLVDGLDMLDEMKLDVVLRDRRSKQDAPAGRCPVISPIAI